MTLICKKCGKKAEDFSLIKTKYTCALCERKAINKKLKKLVKNFGI